MADTRQAMLRALEAAIQAEVEGHHFYRMVAATTSDPLGREVFEALARDEVQHAQWLRVQHHALSESGSFDLSVALGRPQHDPSSPIFSDSLKKRAATAHFEMTALSVGIQLESNGQAHYRALADAAQEPEVKALFLRLAEWESGHYHALLAQLEALKEDYWAVNRFAPF